MNILQNRIDSFQNNSVKWPYAEKQQYHKTETFAKAGFYFMRRPKAVDSVRCFMCDIDLSHWKPGQSPYARHSAESPTCPWALLNFPDASSAHRSLTVNEKDPTTQPQHKIMRAARLATYNHHHYWPPKKSLKSRRFQVASKLSDAGFYFTPTLESSARIKCPYCRATIMEPEKTIDALATHRKLNGACVFFHQRKLGTRGKNRRDTTASTASNDTYKTAASQLDSQDQQEEKEKEDYIVPQKRKQEQEEKEDDSVWDISHFLNIPAHVKKPTLTYGNKSTQSRARQRVLPSVGKKPNVDIFSNLDLSSSPSLAAERSLESRDMKKPSLIEKIDVPKPKPTRAIKKREPERPRTVKEKAAAAAAVAAPSKATIEPPSSSSLSTIPAQEPQSEEALLMSPVFPPPDPVVLDQPLKAIPIKFNEPRYEPPPPQQSLKDMIFGEENEGPVRPTTTTTTSTTSSKDKGKARQVEHAIVPKKPLSLSKTGRPSIPATRPPTSPTRIRNSDVAASLAKQMKYLQSTPMNNGIHSNTVNAMDIFGDCPLSPITTTTATSTTKQNNAHIRTPAVTTGSSVYTGESGRTRTVFTADGQRLPLPKTDAPVLTLDVNAAPPVTAEQKKMSVEMYLQHVVDENIRKVRQQGDGMIAAIREKSDGIKQSLLSQKH
ncbi:hypothetical protein PS15m_003207 [Mucor circinelloides]